MSRMRIYIQGDDIKGWAIDHDVNHLRAFIRETGHREVGGFLLADLVHSVMWTQLLLLRNYPLRFKRVIATASNFIRLENDDFKRAARFVDLWIAPSRRQLALLQQAGLKAAYQPFYVESGVFRSMDRTREELARELGIDYGLIRDKVLLGSFQRDTEGADLVTPKWQKGPEQLMDVLTDLPAKDRWLLLLAGPRRHYVVSECERRGIPYLFYGDKPVAGRDDIGTAIHDLETMAKLYNLIDCYLVTSQSEGGPKAVIEAAFCKTMIFSTRVGFAEDMLSSNCIYREKHEAIAKLASFVGNHEGTEYRAIRETNYQQSIAIGSRAATLDRWKAIYRMIDTKEKL